MIHYLSVNEIALLLGKNESSIRAMHLPKPDADTGVMPGTVRLLWLPATISEWLEERNV